MRGNSGCRNFLKNKKALINSIPLYHPVFVSASFVMDAEFGKKCAHREKISAKVIN
jgi:hypothetical protein